MFYLQTQHELVYKKVTSVIEDIVRPMTDPSQIEHKVLTSTVIPTLKEYDSTNDKVFKVATTGSSQTHPGCKGCPQHYCHANDTWCFPFRNGSVNS